MFYEKIFTYFPSIHHSNENYAFNISSLVACLFTAVITFYLATMRDGRDL
jgi:hypothetical protein